MSYTVQRGDSLSKIAQRLGIPWQTLYEWNRDVVGGNPNLIFAGQVLRTQSPSTPAPVSAPTPAPQAVTGGYQTGVAATEGTPKIDFAKDILPWEQYFDPNLALSSAAQRAGGYYTPLVQRSREGIESDYASRGLTRSSMRARDVMDSYKNYAEQEQKMREQLYTTKEKEERESYGMLQSQYEDNPAGFQKNKYKAPKYDYDYPVESPQKYGQAYRDWLRSAYKI